MVSPGQAPQGFRIHTDPTGFSVAIPSEWKRSVTDTRTYFRDPSGSSYLMIDQTTQPKPNAVADWQAQEPKVGRTFTGYRKIRLEPVAYKGLDTADWEFTWQSGALPIHVLNRNVRANDRRAYALYWSVPDKEWPTRKAQFDVIAGSFQPAP